jgi:hypothetical protein
VLKRASRSFIDDPASSGILSHNDLTLLGISSSSIQTCAARARHENKAIQVVLPTDAWCHMLFQVLF